MTDFEEQTGATDIIDATQSAVIDAVNSVSQLIEKQTQTTVVAEQPAPHEAFYLSAEFWVGIAFFIALLMILRPAFKAFKKLLEKRRNNIINTLAEAENLHLQAQKLLAAYERRFQNAKNEIETLTQKAAEELDAYALEKNDMLEKDLLKKQNEAERIIQTAVRDARAQMNSAVSKKTMEIIYDYIEKNIDDKKRAELIDNSIERIVKEL